jgi:hypothetical protein
MSGMERTGSRTVFEGKVAGVRVDEFRYPDGSTSEREVVTHPGAVAVVAHDGTTLYLVRQPREAVNEPALLELPAGKLDVEGESRLECALKRLYTSPGFAEEEVTVFLATGLSDVEARPDDEERIEIVRWPLEELDRAIDECADSKSLVGLLLFRDMRRSGAA